MGKRTNSPFIISVDVETNGPAPLVNSMWQLGAAFYDDDGNEIDSFQANLEEVPGTQADQGTLAWWAEQENKNPGLMNQLRSNLLSPTLAMQQFTSKVQRHSRELGSQPLVVAYPAGFDFTWLYVYLVKFTGKSVVGFSALDMKTMAMTLLQRNYHDSAKRRFPASWFDPKLKHTHMALDDAREQGYTYFQMRKAMHDSWNGNTLDGQVRKGDPLAALGVNPA